ncbi:hypothetical protein ACI65C_000290 [Semiaphis heraclei]
MPFEFMVLHSSKIEHENSFRLKNNCYKCKNTINTSFKPIPLAMINKSDALCFGITEYYIAVVHDINFTKCEMINVSKMNYNNDSTLKLSIVCFVIKTFLSNNIIIFDLIINKEHLKPTIKHSEFSSFCCIKEIIVTIFNFKIIYVKQNHLIIHFVFFERQTFILRQNLLKLAQLNSNPRKKKSKVTPKKEIAKSENPMLKCQFKNPVKISCYYVRFSFEQMCDVIFFFTCVKRTLKYNILFLLIMFTTVYCSIINVPKINMCPHGMHRVASSCIYRNAIVHLDTSDDDTTIQEDQMDLNNSYEY